jgi:NAD(P)-dependent dehydrogenase (short-subunit alcohol dehydrogenase family)
METINLPISKAALIGMGGIGCAMAQQLINNTQAELFTLSRQSRPSFKCLNEQRWRHVTLSDYNQPELQAAAKTIGSLDLLICSLGCLHSDQLSPEKRIESLAEDSLMHYFRINAVLPTLVIQSFWPFLKKAQPTLLACISAKVGSIEDNKTGGWYGYRASKAALNMLIKTSSIEFNRRAPNLKMIAIHPGTTDTYLSKPFQGHLPEGQLKTPESCAQSLMKTLLSTTAPSGSFLHWDGAILPW